MPNIWRSKKSYVSRDPEKRAKQIGNLTSQEKGEDWGNLSKYKGDLSKYEGAEGFKRFMVTHCRNLEGKVSIILP